MERIDFKATPQEPIQGHTSKGDQPKWFRAGRWYKADHMGYEALAEVVISRLLAKSNVSSFVDYAPVFIAFDGKEKPGCMSKTFLQPNEMLVPFERLHRAYKGLGMAQAISRMDSVADKLAYVSDFVESTTVLTQVTNYLSMLVELDAFFLNEDRHTNNLAVIRNEITHEYRLCPVFDNGLALLSDLNDYPLGADIFDCIGRVRAKPFSTSFDEQFEAVADLPVAHLHFSFTKHDVSETLSEMSVLYPPEIINRVEDILLEQMRKYSVFFK